MNDPEFFDRLAEHYFNTFKEQSYRESKPPAIIEQKWEYIRQIIQKEGIAFPAGAFDIQRLLDVPLEDLALIALRGRRLMSDDEEKAHEGFTVSDARVQIAQGCHVSAAINWLIADNKEEIDIYSGFDGYHFHSWLVYEAGRLIIEPTPVIRDTYYGAKMDALSHCRSEWPITSKLSRSSLSSILKQAQAVLADML